MKIMSLILIPIFLVFSLSGISNATTSASEVSTAKIVFSDGSYCISTIEELFESGCIRSAQVKSGRKTSHYYTANNELQFSVTVQGTFEYSGTSAIATSSNYSYTIANTQWRFVSGSSRTTYNCAVATCIFSSQNIADKTYSTTLYCSPTGVLS